MGLMKDSGCGSILIGLESTSEKNLIRMDKKINLKRNYVDAIRKIQSHGILVHGSFILGYDFDDASAFDELIDFIDQPFHPDRHCVEDLPHEFRITIH